ncbi:MAG: DUF935 family protein [Lentimicrobium sp.]|jgi:hypothetical protein|nr:DUF935 family protein [Lentimicrobium sp.]
MGIFSNIFPAIGLARQPQASPVQLLINSKKRASYAVKPPPQRQVSYEINDIKMAIVTATASDRPDRARLIAIYDYIMQDSHLASQVMVAVNKVISEPFALYKGNKPDDEASKILETSWFEELVTHCIEAEFYGYSLVELFVNRDKSIEEALILRQCVQPDLKLLLPEGTIHGKIIPYGEALEELSLIQFGAPADLGILQKAAYNVLWKFYARSDWSRASEKFGMPILWIEADTNQDAELDRLEQKAAGFGSDGYIVTQAGDKVQIVERTGQDIHKIYLENIRYCDEQNSKLINGQTGTSDNQAWAGTSQVQERLLEDINFARMRRVKYAINAQVLPYLINKGFANLKGIEFDYRSIREPQAKVQAVPEPDPTPLPEPGAKKKSLSLNRENSLSILYFGPHGENCDCGGDAPLRLNLSRKTEINAAIGEILTPDSSKANSTLFDLYFKDYQKAIGQVFPSGVNDDLAHRFRLNMAEFAAHKAYKATAEIKEIANAKDAQAIARKYERFQQAELTSVTARARSARQWQRFEAERKLFPNLTWLRTRSATARELHAGYVGITLPMNHEFWQNNQPGNLWNCKCDWKTTDAPVTSAPGKIAPPARGLEGNPFDTGELITNKHPYYREAPKWVKRNAMLLLPDELAYQEVKVSNGTIREHIFLQYEGEAAGNRAMANQLLTEKIGFKDVKLLPRIDVNEQALRQKYYGKAFCEEVFSRCPDCQADGIIVEFKTSFGNPKTIKTRLMEAGEKSSLALIKIERPPSKKVLLNIVMGVFYKEDLVNRILIFDREYNVILDQTKK